MLFATASSREVDPVGAVECHWLRASAAFMMLIFGPRIAIWLFASQSTIFSTTRHSPEKRRLENLHRLGGVKVEKKKKKKENLHRGYAP